MLSILLSLIIAIFGLSCCKLISKVNNLQDKLLETEKEKNQYLNENYEYECKFRDITLELQKEKKLYSLFFTRRHEIC